MATLLVATGKAIVTNYLSGGAASVPKYIGWGTGAGTTANTDTSLFTEAGSTRTTGTPTQVTSSTTNDTYQVTGTSTASGSLAVTNSGLFDNATVGSGNLFAKGDFGTINLNSGDSIAFTWKVQFS
jgi:hypothetical protein